jgi:hypothetical protein
MPRWFKSKAESEPVFEGFGSKFLNARTKTVSQPSVAAGLQSMSASQPGFISMLEHGKHSSPLDTGYVRLDCGRKMDRTAV